MRLLFVVIFGLVLSTSASAAAIVYDALGEPVGLHVDPYALVSGTGFRFRVDGSTGKVASDGGDIRDIHNVNYSNTVRFATSDCSGQAYAVVSSAGPVAGGVVLQADAASNRVFYVPKGVTGADVALLTEIGNGGICVQDGGSMGVKRVVPVFENEPSVTGVRSGVYPVPMRLEVEPLSVLFDLFKDGFESSMLTTRLICSSRESGRELTLGSGCTVHAYVQQEQESQGSEYIFLAEV